MRQRRTYDPGPVLELAERRAMDAGHLDTATLRPTCIGMAEAIGVTTRTVQRWRAGAPLGAAVADEVAIALGTHPVLLWPDYCDAAA